MSFVLAGPALVTLAASLLLFLCIWHVGRMRLKHRVVAPAISGHLEFEIALRVQMNTLENIVLMLPVLWLAALYFSPLWATALGAVWLGGRIWYALAYVREPKTRGGGYLLGMLAYGALGLLAAWGVVRAALA